MTHRLWVVLTLLFVPLLEGADIARLTPQTWDEFAPLGKEVDCIYGDYVLRNDHIIAVIADPLPTRNANMTVRNVGAMVIDLTQRESQSDQLSCYYPNAMPLRFTDPKTVTVKVSDKVLETSADLKAAGVEVEWSATTTAPSGLEVTVRYTLRDRQNWLRADTVLRNPKDEAITQEITDLIRADRTFEFGSDETSGLFWAQDDFFQQCYGVLMKERRTKSSGGRNNVLQLLDGQGSNKITVSPGASVTIERHLIPSANLLQLREIVESKSGGKLIPVQIECKDDGGPVSGARLSVMRNGKPYGSGRADRDGKLAFQVAAGNLHIVASAIGRDQVELDVMADGAEVRVPVSFARCAYVVANITNEQGQRTPCKIAFHGKSGTPSPDFGPDSSDTAVKNVYYSHSGSFRQEIAPGKYDVIISYGPEHDAVFTEISTEPGKETVLGAMLRRVVNTSGWISADFHSHSTPSGDNTASQLGRIQNLLCEHVEFCPCTEHNRIDSYAPLLKKLGVESLMATCTGMELTGEILPVNHQNAFPLVHKPRTQDGGGPATDQSPIVQIERLAMWDGGSDKLVQENHPNLVQILTDKDEDGKFDGGFNQMFGFMDVVEIHPLPGIFSAPTRGPDKKLSRNPVYHWMQMLNLGFRIPGVINTDAHYNYHESGWMRNYLRSPTDDPAKIDTMDMVHTAEQGHMVCTTGPFMEVSCKAKSPESKKASGIPGDDVVTMNGPAELHVRVQCPNWFDINRVQVFLNGRPDKALNFTRRDHPRSFQDGVVKFDSVLPLELKVDSHVIVAAIGEGMALGPVMGPERGKQAPIAVSNPIFVDVDGKGFEPNGDLLDVPLPK